IAAAPTAAQAGNSSTLTITIPPGYNSSLAVTVTVSSASSSVVSVGGGATSNVVFAAGGSNVKTITAQFVGAGSSVLSVAGQSPLVGSSVTLQTLATPSVTETFRAASLTGLNNGDLVTSWLGDINSTAANALTVAPLFKANATPSGGPAVQFLATSNAFLAVDASVDPSATLTNFSVVAVYKATAPSSNGSLSWWDMAGLMDAEENGFPADWGLEVDANGYAVFGTGSANGQVSASGYNTVGSVFHVVVASYDSINGVSTIQVDDQAATVQTNLVGLPRIAGTLPIRIGANQYGTFFNGEIAELRIYNGALSASQATGVINTLKGNYGLTFTSDLGPYLLQVVNSGSAVQITWPTTATAAGFVLESSTNVNSGWATSGLSIGTSGTNSIVTDSVTNAARFYRLHHP
ncbi:MAG: hypothetical protein QM813_03005, partial [Verrucomicrobiota bacterium]